MLFFVHPAETFIFYVALRVGKGSMGMQGITELFHPWARKSFYWMCADGKKFLKKFRE